MPEDANLRLRQALGVTQPMRLAVSTDSQPKPEYIDIDSSYAVLGRGTGCDVVLPDKGTSFRHAYLQAFGDRVLCVDLLSASGIRWDGPDQQGWLTPAHRIEIGTARVQLLDDGWNAGGNLWPSPLDFKTRDHQIGVYGALPDVHLELANRQLRGAKWPINRVMTLLGRDSRCRITCGDDRISRVHCSLLLTPVGLWVIDLLGRGGITVNGQQQALALLQDGDELGIGQYRMQAVYESPPAAPLESEGPADTTEFPVTAVPQPATEHQSSAEVRQPAASHSPVVSLPTPEFLTRNNRIFPVEFVGDTIVVSPRGGIRTAPYQQMQLESNIITQLLQTRPALKNVIVDVGATDAMDSIIISCVSSICRAARHRAAICHCSDAMLGVLNEMSLTKVWPYFETRDEALTHVNP